MLAREELDPAKSRNYRDITAIVKQLALADSLMKDKSIEMLSSKELQDIGLTCNEVSDYDNAKRFFTMALDKLHHETVLPNEKFTIITNCHYGLANIERELGNDQDAVIHFLSASAESEFINHESKEYGSVKYDIERNLGIAYLKMEDADKAANCFAKALDVAKKFDRKELIPAVESYLGLSLVLRGDMVQGFAHLNAARELYPEDMKEKSMDWASHRYHMARAYQVSGEHVKAIAEFNEALRLRLQIIGPEIGSVYFNSRIGDCHAGLGQSYLAIKNDEEAAKWLGKAMINYDVIRNNKKSEKIASLLSTISIKENNGVLNNKYFQIGAATAVAGLGFFAYRLLSSNGSVDSVPTQTIKP